MARRYDHVVFDLDGTLIDSAADMAAAVNHARACHGLPALAVPAVWRHVGTGVRDLLAAVLPALADAEIEGAVALYRAHYHEHLLDTTRPYPGVEAALRAIAASGLSVSVLTNKPAATARAILTGLGLEAHFAAILGGDSLAARKPDPIGLHEIARRVGVALPRLLLVGDTPVDRDTARAAPADFCAALWGTPVAALRGERLAARHPAELLSLAGIAPR